MRHLHVFNNKRVLVSTYQEFFSPGIKLRDNYMCLIIAIIIMMMIIIIIKYLF